MCIESQGVQRTRFKWSFFRIFEIKSFCFNFVMFDLVHDMRAIHGLY